ncbi:hypothetical protein, partial [Streptomyces sp. GSL17-113]|uniref:hypothetical protein n=1 Tax=Streptomyces sp. GSL17-113 TaxID=3115365 RepID=UPI002E78FEB8
EFAGSLLEDRLGAAPRPRRSRSSEVLALGGFEGLPQDLDLVTVPSLELSELGGEGAHDVAG